MAKAEFVGIEAINENLKEFKFDAIGVFQGKLEKFKRSLVEDETEDDLIEHFNKWADRMLSSNPNNYQVYAIQLYELPDGARKLQGTTSFTFQLVEKVANHNAQSQKESSSGAGKGFVTERELQQALEIQRLEFEKHNLERELAEDSYDDDEDEDEEPIGYLGAIQNAVQDKIPQLVDLLIAALTKSTMPQQPMQQSVGIGSHIDEIISEFRKINPNIENDLAKLLLIAKTNKPLFDMLIKQLRSM